MCQHGFLSGSTAPRGFSCYYGSRSREDTRHLSLWARIGGPLGIGLDGTIRPAGDMTRLACALACRHRPAQVWWGHAAFETDGRVGRPPVRTTFENEDHRLTVYVTHRQFPRPRSPLVIDEGRRLRRVPRK